MCENMYNCVWNVKIIAQIKISNGPRLEMISHVIFKVAVLCKDFTEIWNLRFKHVLFKYVLFKWAQDAGSGGGIKMQDLGSISKYFYFFF